LKRLLLAVIVAGMACPQASLAQRGSRPARASAPPTAAAASPDLRSSSALVIDQNGNRVLYAKNVDAVVPVASITKLMTAVVVLDSGAPLGETIVISEADLDEIKHTRSRLRVGTALTRNELLRLALMASENRAAAALARSHEGGTREFATAMNRKAASLGMLHTRFVDGTGLSSDNVSTAQDLSRLVIAAYDYPLIREFTTAPSYAIALENGRLLQYNNSNRLVRSEMWDIGLSKTGFINEAGRCLVMQSRIASRQVIIVLLDSWGKLTRIGDANRIKRWMESRYSRLPEG
jgi:D-alanyl-D-alanine endopeptidase (penicillin-binding protein 7)